jgi:hypothetical protein
MTLGIPDTASENQSWAWGRLRNGPNLQEAGYVGVMTVLIPTDRPGTGHPSIYSKLFELQGTTMYYTTLEYHLTRANAGLSS